MANKTKLHFWTEAETLHLIRTLKEHQILKYMDGRKTRNGDLFKKVSKELAKANFCRSAEQVRVRWKSLKTAYYKAKRANDVSGHDPQTSPFYTEMNDLLGHRPLSTVEGGGVNVGFPQTQSTQEQPMEPDRSASEEDVDLEVEVEEDVESDQDIPSTLAQATGRERRGRRPAWEQQQIFLQEQERRQTGLLHQLARESAERQERFVGAILDSNARMMAMLLESLQTRQQPSTAPLPPFYPGYYPPNNRS
ncbi:hypothetical protein ACEWY4_003940 [Coilia grayii]|uniref:Myb/SANT-like DNA-binding domain-containing protein n=1 Tax=Coilia grayii TaxID=363190 RepID=A0ABD1KKP5_9TELE